MGNIPEASNFYLALSYKFSTQALNRPNFAKLLAARADEERDHAHGFAKFQLSRGGDVDIGVIGKSDIAEVDTVAEALEKMIEKEKTLTRELLNLNKLAENGNCASDSCSDALITEDGKAPHLSDLLTGTYLPDQLADINELKTHQARLAAYGDDEILFDRLLL